MTTPIDSSALPKTNARTAWGLLNAICRIILEEPKRLNMDVVCYRDAGIRHWNGLINDYVAPQGIPECGTIGCIAGWTDVLTGHSEVDMQNGSQTWRAMNTLGLSASQEIELFRPESLLNANNIGTRKHALTTVAHIRKFQREHYAQLKATPVDIPLEWRA